MTCFVDTSAFYAVLDADDRNHSNAKTEWEALVRVGEPLVTTNYVLVETFALLQHRIGMDAVRVFQEDIFPVLRVEWIDESAHVGGITGVLAGQRRGVSLVDNVSFFTMRRLGIRDAFAFDQHFSEHGFRCRP
jgi:predicted nucleic acid-binding protein